MDLLDQGNYLANPLDWGEGQGKTNPGYKYVWVDFQPDQTKRPVRWFGSINSSNDDGSPNTKFQYTIKALELMGLNYEKIGDFGNGQSSGALDSNSTVQIVVKHSERNGRINANVAFINPKEDSETKARTTGLFAQQLTKYKDTAAIPAAKPAGDGDIPF